MDRGRARAAEPVLVTFYIDPDYVGDVREYLEENGVFVRNVGEDYIEAHVPPGLLGDASELPGVLRVDTVIPPRPAQTRENVASQGVGLHGAEAWHDAGVPGQQRSGRCHRQRAFRDSAVCKEASCPAP